MFKINDRKVGADYPPLVIAEVGINHEGEFDKAIAMVDSALDCQADIVKFQCHITEKEMIKTSMTPGQISTESLWDIVKRCELTEEEEIKIKKYCDQKSIIYLSTPFSREAADRLDKMGVPAFKIGSGECNNLPLLHHIASKGKPIILSTGMNDLASIKKSVEVLRKYKVPFALLHCTSMYPTPYNKVRLGAIEDLRKNFPDAVVGLSDHSLNIYTCLGAVALGACILEKHFTLTRSWPGPDISISIEPGELKELVLGSRAVWEARGGSKTILEEEKPVVDFAYSTVVSIASIRKGEVFSKDNVWVKRPGTGEISASELEDVLGKVATDDIPVDTQIKRIHISK
jgi:N-acetylneuraminate synthase